MFFFKGHADKSFYTSGNSATLKWTNKNKLISYTNWTELENNLEDSPDSMHNFFPRRRLNNKSNQNTEEYFICERNEQQNNSGMVKLNEMIKIIYKIFLFNISCLF